MDTAAPVGARTGWTFAQWGLLVICILHLVQAVIGFIANAVGLPMGLAFVALLLLGVAVGSLRVRL